MGALALLVTVAVLGTTVYAQETRYVAIGSSSTVFFSEQTMVILDCLPFAINTYGVEANLSTFVWSRIATKPPEDIGETVVITEVTPRVTLSDNRERLTINALAIATGAEVGSEAAYNCMVCANNVPPDELQCASSNLTVNVNSPPILECDMDRPPTDFGAVTLAIGCDLCLEVGQSLFLLTINCMPDTTRSTDCTMTTPNGTDVGTINDQTGTITVQRSGASVESVIILDIANPDPLPLGYEVLGTWMCECNNSDGRAAAASKLGSCASPPIIDKGIPKPPIVDFPPYVSSGSRSFKIGSNDFLLQGQSFTISCPLAFEGDPPADVAWFKGEDELTMYADFPSISISTFTNSSTVEGAGNYTCTATNIAGLDTATSYIRAGIEIVRPPMIVMGPIVPVPSNVEFVDQVELIGTDIHIIQGRTATIQCQLGDAGLPAAPIEWTRNGMPLNQTVYPLTNGGDTLVISNVSAMDEATYCCSAENVAGISSACSGVFVSGGGPFLREGIVIEMPVNPARVYLGTQTVDIGGTAYAVEGSSFEVLCPVTFAEPPATTFMWTYVDGGMEVSIATHNNASNMTMLQIGDTEFLVTTDINGQISRLIAMGNDTGFMVMCTATSPIGSASATSTFSTFTAPIIDDGEPTDIPLELQRSAFVGKIGSTVHVVEGEDAVIDCSIIAETGLPEDSVDYIWYYNGEVIMNNGKFMISVSADQRSSTLTVDNFVRADNGQISCVAFNPAGQSQVSSEVFVYSDVLIDKGNATTVIGPGEPLTGMVGDKFLVPVGERAYINCDLADAGGFPYDSSVSPPLPADVQWCKDGEPVPLTLFSSSHGNQLCVDINNANDSGNYECKVTSRIVDNPGAEEPFQMDSAVSNVMVVSGPVIDRGILPDSPPEGTVAVAVGTGQTRVISTGTDVIIRCVLMSTTMPESIIIWSRFTNGISEEITDDGSKFMIVTTDRESELTIAMFDATDVATYRCTAENTVGSDVADVRLNLCPSDSMLCPVPIPMGQFNISLDVTEGLSDTCPYCATWITTPFGPCEPNCHAGLKRRYVRCETTDGRRVIDDELCDAVEPMPPMVSDCQADFAGVVPDERACQLDPRWKIWPWSACSGTCAGSKQTRVVKCLVPRTGVPMPDLECPSKPETERPCNEGVPCGCTDAYSSCKYVDGQMCLREQIRYLCCASCTGGRSNLYH